VLNPNDHDLDGFIFHTTVAHSRSGFQNAISGCLLAASKQICGPTLLDSAYNGVGLAMKDDPTFEEMRVAGSYHLKLEAQTIDFAAQSAFIVRLKGSEFSGAFSTALMAGLPVVKDLAIAFDPVRHMVGVKPAPLAPALHVNVTNALPPLEPLTVPSTSGSVPEELRRGRVAKPWDDSTEVTVDPSQ
jgi:hypothetical protein